jgi:hypothetical protein
MNIDCYFKPSVVVDVFGCVHSFSGCVVRMAGLRYWLKLEGCVFKADRACEVTL